MDIRRYLCTGIGSIPADVMMNMHVVFSISSSSGGWPMLQYLDPVPFTFENESHLGLSETQGMLSTDGRCLVVEYRIVDTIIGAIKTPSSTLQVPLADIYSIAYQKKYFGLTGAILLRTRNQQALEALPDARMGTIRMSIKRGDREIARAFCLEIHEVIVRQRSQMLLDDLARLEQGDIL